MEVESDDDSVFEKFDFGARKKYAKSQQPTLLPLFTKYVEAMKSPMKPDAEDSEYIP